MVTTMSNQTTTKDTFNWTKTCLWSKTRLHFLPRMLQKIQIQTALWPRFPLQRSLMLPRMFKLAKITRWARKSCIKVQWYWRTRTLQVISIWFRRIALNRRLSKTLPPLSKTNRMLPRMLPSLYQFSRALTPLNLPMPLMLPTRPRKYPRRSTFRRQFRRSRMTLLIWKLSRMSLSHLMSKKKT